LATIALADVAYALVRAASRLISTPSVGRKFSKKGVETSLDAARTSAYATSMMNRRTAILGTMGALAAQSAKPRNILFILSDDHRYDAMGFLKGQKFLETPHLDSLARDGIHCKNGFVTTALCSPSRASILTG